MIAFGRLIPKCLLVSLIGALNAFSKTSSASLAGILPTALSEEVSCMIKEPSVSLVV